MFRFIHETFLRLSDAYPTAISRTAYCKRDRKRAFFIQSLQNADIPLFCSEIGDYQTRDTLFEIGGKNKTRKQLKEASLPSYLVKDNILRPLNREIPLFHCGFLY